MQNRLWKFLSIILFLIGSQPASAQETPDEFAGVARERIINDVDHSIRRHFAHWQGARDFDYEASFRAYRAEALVAPDRATFGRLTQAFVAQLNNGHTFFYDSAVFERDPGNLGFVLRQYDDGWVVIRSRRSNVAPGAIVTAIDGSSVEDAFQQTRPLLSGSNERARRTIYSSYAAYFPQQFTLLFADGRSAAVDRTVPPDVASPAPTEALSIQWLETGIAYLRITSFSARETEQRAMAALSDTFAEADTIILDVRGNGGGTSPNRLGRQLLGSDWRNWRTSEPTRNPEAPPRRTPSSARYIVLVDRGCASACEDFVMPFSMSDKAILVGETTMGTSGQPEVTQWSNGMELWVSRRRQWFPDGRPFEGVGVTPDIAVTLSAADFQHGAADRILECARTLARHLPCSAGASRE